MNPLKVAYINTKKIAATIAAETGEELLGRFLFHQEVITRQRKSGEKQSPPIKFSKKEHDLMIKAFSAHLVKKWEARDLKKAQMKRDKEMEKGKS